MKMDQPLDKKIAGSVPVSIRCLILGPSMSQIYDQMISVETKSPSKNELYVSYSYVCM